MSAPDGDMQAEGSEGALAADADRWAAWLKTDG